MHSVSGAGPVFVFRQSN